MFVTCRLRPGLLFKVRAVWLAVLFLTAFSVNSVHAEKLVLAAAETRPTAYMENGKPTGLLVEIVTEAFRRVGYPIEIKLMPWKRCLSEARQGTIDGVFSSFKFPEREAFLAFTDVPIITQVEAFFVRSNSDIQFDGDLEKLKEERIGVIRGTSYGIEIDTLLDDGTWEHVERTNSIDDMLSMLVSGRFDIMPSYRHVVLAAAKESGLIDQIKELSPSVVEIPSYLAFSRSRDYTEIILAFNSAMNAMKEDKTFDAITEKYLDRNSSL